MAGGKSKNNYLIDWEAKDENEGLSKYEIGMKEKKKWDRF